MKPTMTNNELVNEPKIHRYLKKIGSTIEKEPFFFIVFLITAVLSFISLPHISAVNWNVISTMFCLMTVCAGFERCNLLSSLAKTALSKFDSPRKLGFAMIFVTGILAMFVTNDVALLTVVPLTLTMARVSKRNPCILIILETISANIFSAMTPFGNPQNLYLYSFYKISPTEFFSFMIPICLFGGIILCFSNLILSKGKRFTVKKEKIEISDKRLLVLSAIAFVINILSVLRIIDYRIALAVTVIIFLFSSPRLLIKPDFFLLFTFILFFLFTDSITGIPAITKLFSSILVSPKTVLVSAAGLSQIISNVPAAVLLSGFTGNYKAILLGVTIGGLGTLVASLASLISYKLYIREYKNGHYLLIYSVLNFAILIIMLFASMLFI